MFENNNVTKDSLLNLGIHDLRIYASKIGVKSAYSKRKEILVQDILDVLEGKVKPTFTNRGRPSLKSKLNYSDYQFTFSIIDFDKDKEIARLNAENNYLKEKLLIYENYFNALKKIMTLKD